MLFTEKIKELRIQNQMPQRQIAAALEIDTATYCKIEKGERKAKKRTSCNIIGNVSCRNDRPPYIVACR